MIKVDVAQFSQTIENFVEKTKGKEREFALEFIQDINEAIVEDTPVKIGFLRGSWWASINDAATAPGIVDPGGTQTVARANLKAAEIAIGDIYYMLNGAKYAARVEYGFVGKDSLGREYNQQPSAFVRKTVDRAQEFAKDAVERVSKT